MLSFLLVYITTYLHRWHTFSVYIILKLLVQLSYYNTLYHACPYVHVHKAQPLDWQDSVTANYLSTSSLSLSLSDSKCWP